MRGNTNSEPQTARRPVSRRRPSASQRRSAQAAGITHGGGHQSTEALRPQRWVSRMRIRWQRRPLPVPQCQRTPREPPPQPCTRRGLKPRHGRCR